MADIPITFTRIGMINANKTAKLGDRYVDPDKNIWVGTQFGTLIIPPLASQIYSLVSPENVDDRLKDLKYLPNTQILVGNASNEATPVAASGDISIKNTGAVSFAASGIAKIRTINSLGVL